MKYLGKTFLLKLEDPNTPGSYLTVSNCRSNTASKTNDKIDVTDKDGMPWTELIEGGIQSIECSGAGVFSDADTVDLMQRWADAGNIKNFRIVDGKGNTKTGPFLVASFEQAGEHSKEITYSFKLSSAGMIVSDYATDH